MSEINTENEEQLSSTEYAAKVTLERMTNSAKFYSQKRADGELDLVQATRKMLAEAGADEEKLIAHYDTDRFVKEAADKHAHAQQFQLNRFFNGQFCIIDAEDGGDTRLLRYQLIYEVKPSEWLTIMKKSVIPGFVELGLPRG
jgi:hypothetical protein